MADIDQIVYNGVVYDMAGSGGGEQANWDETDSEAGSYIQNRPFGYTYGYKSIILDHQIIYDEYTYDDEEYTYYDLWTETDAPIQINDIFILTVTAEQYQTSFELSVTERPEEDQNDENGRYVILHDENNDIGLFSFLDDKALYIYDIGIKIRFGETFTISLNKNVEERYYKKLSLDKIDTSIRNGTAYHAITTSKNNHANGAFSFASGSDTSASGEFSHTEGISTVASEQATHAEGGSTVASYYYAHAEGNMTRSQGFASHAEGDQTEASGDGSHAEGIRTTVSYSAAHAEGQGTTAGGYAAHAEGTSTSATAGSAHAEGSNTTASGVYSHAEGASTVASGISSHAEGSNTIAKNKDQHVFGMYNIQDPSNADSASHGTYIEIIGNGTGQNARSNARTLDWSGNEWVAGNLSIGGNTLTVGGQPISTRPALLYVSNGMSEKAETVFSGAVSRGRTAISTIGNSSFAFGSQVTANGSFSHAEGTSTTAGGTNSHAEGEAASATGTNAHAEGHSTSASGNSSHAEGRNSTASAYYTHAEGAYTAASGSSAHAEGYRTEARSEYSHAEGNYTIAASASQHVQGKYNIIDDLSAYAHIIGNGTSTSSRSNATTVDWNGNGWFAGKVSAGTVASPATPTAANDLTTKQYVDNAISNMSGGGGSGLQNVHDGTGTETRFDGAISHGRKLGSTIGNDSYAFGFNVVASGSLAHAEGYYTVASGDYSHAEGYGGTYTENGETKYFGASANYTHSEGINTIASNAAAHAEGNRTTASGTYSHTEGYGTKATASGAHAEGYNTQATEMYAHAEGSGSIASGQKSHAEGDTTKATATMSHAEGNHSEARGSDSHAEGTYSIAYEGAAHAEGYYSAASGFASHAECYRSKSIGTYSHAEGYDNVAIGEGSHAEGHGRIVTGQYSHAEGSSFGAYSQLKLTDGSEAKKYTYTYGTPQVNDLIIYGNSYATITNIDTENSTITLNKALSDTMNDTLVEAHHKYISGYCSHAEGYETCAIGAQSHAEGYNTIARGTSSHVEGDYTESSTNASYSHAEGYQTKVYAAGAHAEGYTTNAVGSDSHAEGLYTSAIGSHSHAEGSYSCAVGYAAHAEGYGRGVDIYISSTGTNTVYSGYVSGMSAGDLVICKDLMAYVLAVNEQNNTFTTDTPIGANLTNTPAYYYKGYAKGNYSHTEGYATIATGGVSHAGGQYNVREARPTWPLWQANTQYKVGDKVKRYNNDTAAYVCVADNNDAEWNNAHWKERAGLYNFAEIIGNGFAHDDRSNARALDWEGNEYLRGNIYVGCNIDSTGGTQLAKVTDIPEFATDAETENIITEWSVGA